MRIFGLDKLNSIRFSVTLDGLHESRRNFMPRLWFIPHFLILVILGVDSRAQELKKPLEFHITFDPSVSSGAFTGRVFVMVSRQVIKDQPVKPKWFNTDPIFAVDVKDWKPGTKLVVGDKSLGFPEPLAKLARETYSIQAIMDFDQGSQNAVNAPGNAYSKPIRLEVDPEKTGAIRLTVEHTIPGRKFEESERVKLLEIDSKLLSAFHGKPMRLRAGVVLPKSFSENLDQRYPVIYEIPGFGGNHFMAHGALARNATEVGGFEMLHVVLDPDCRLGHHVFADSDNNGPCGRALIAELIPAIEGKFRGLGTARGRFVTGHSSGGWSSLWLQVTYPDFFGGVWSTAPDPVDFRDFQRVNIYEPKINLFADDKGEPRPLARKGGKVIMHYKPFSDLEQVLGHGGQLESFEGVFSPRGKDGKPRKLWDRFTGNIDPEVAKSWQRYDIRMVLEKNWPALSTKLAGKLHVYMGAEDNFYLDGATLLLKQSLAKLGSDAVVEIFPGRDHGSLMDQALRQRIANEMADRFRQQDKKSP
jgi:S-formylglutathione hydrolase FrmB